MILYNGNTFKNTKQHALIASLQTDCLTTLDTENYLTPDIVIDACNQLVTQIKHGDYDSLITPLLESYNIPQDKFDYYISMFTKDALTKKLDIELGKDYQSLSDLNQSNKREIHPLGILFHIAAGNVDVLPAYSVIEGLLTGNINILKLPTGDNGLSVKLLSELIKIEPRLKNYIYVFDVPSTDTTTLKQLGNIADAIIVWGGNEAIKAARKMASVNTQVIEWGHKLSFAYASLKATDEEIKGLAKNIMSTNQLFCSSAQGIFVDTTSRDKLDQFAERVFKIFLDTQKDYPPVPFAMKSKNAVELYYQEMVKNKTEKRIWKQDGISVITSNDSNLELSLLFRNIWIKPLPSNAIVTTIKPNKNFLQTASILAPKDDYTTYKNKLLQAGIVRLKKPQDMSEVLPGESHDGEYPLRRYTRIVEYYNK
ncbi:MAG: acyl-CoA reductase [Candidatus Izimaplasma sp.]|nr:acyl-CoA reductase [Candidatus Izimaplasma bacterium]